VHDESKVIEKDNEEDEDIQARKPYNDIEEGSHMAELQQRNVQIMQKEDEQKLNFQKDRTNERESYYETSQGGSRSVNTGGGYTRSSDIQ